MHVSQQCMHGWTWSASCKCVMCVVHVWFLDNGWMVRLEWSINVVGLITTVGSC